MITARYIGDGWYRLDGLSTDPKPLNHNNGTIFHEIDTGNEYKFDAENKRWRVWTGGSGGGTSDYESLENRPQINGTTLSGNKTGAALGLADLASPALTGTPTAPTASAGTNTTQIATTAFVRAALAAAITDAIGGVY